MIKPLADRVVIEPQEAMTKTASGLFIPDTAKEKPQQGVIVAAGPGKKDEPMEVKVGDMVLYGKYAGTEVTVDDKKYAVTRMGRVPFCEVTKDFAVTGCSNILYVSDFDNSNVTSIELPSATKIGEHAFMDCTKLTSVSMPNVEHIYDWAFMGCTALTTCTWGHNLTQIYGYAFKNSGLTQDIILPYGFTYFLVALIRKPPPGCMNTDVFFPFTG